jgi:hypothetical protein
MRESLELADLAKLELPANLFPDRPELGLGRGDDHAEAVSAPVSGASRSQFSSRGLFSSRIDFLHAFRGGRRI